jgi:hypothetical protein|tara:strand:- start:285 stop:434 length:150 start_codon:yes stop_codon:yes gene_type:complete
MEVKNETKNANRNGRTGDICTPDTSKYILDLPFDHPTKHQSARLYSVTF